MDALLACATDSAVIATVASAGYASAMLRLARSARAVGFRCLVVQPYAAFDELAEPLVRALPVPDPPLRPRPLWCGRKRYGWRRSHLHRTRMWRIVLESGYDLLAVDLDWSFVDMRGQPLQWSTPIAALRAARTPPSALHPEGRRRGTCSPFSTPARPTAP